MTLNLNYFNSFNPITTIGIIPPILNETKLKRYNILGSIIITLLKDESFQIGSHRINWNTSITASRRYIYIVNYR